MDQVTNNHLRTEDSFANCSLHYTVTFAIVAAICSLNNIVMKISGDEGRAPLLNGLISTPDNCVKIDLSLTDVIVQTTKNTPDKFPKERGKAAVSSTFFTNSSFSWFFLLNEAEAPVAQVIALSPNATKTKKVTSRFFFRGLLGKKR